MARKWTLGVAVGTAVLAALAIGVVQTRADKVEKNVPDLTGTWRLDVANSSLPGEGRFGGRRGPRGGDHPDHGDARDGGKDRQGPRDGDGDRGTSRRRGPALPPVFRIESHGSVIGFEDSTGTLFQEIRVGSAASGGNDANKNEEVRRVNGRYADGSLVVERAGRNGGTMVQTFKLDDHGRRLEVRMERKGGSEGGREGREGRMGGRKEIKLVYRRAA
jgi:hypothetical protein